jgi:hypothetical protein
MDDDAGDDKTIFVPEMAVKKMSPLRVKTRDICSTEKIVAASNSFFI